MPLINLNEAQPRRSTKLPLVPSTQKKRSHFLFPSAPTPQTSLPEKCLIPVKHFHDLRRKSKHPVHLGQGSWFAFLPP